jgi:hypothetical protein
MRTPCSQQRTHEIQDTFFGEHVPFSFFYSGENSMRTYFFYSREKILCVFHNMTNLQRKKKDFKIRFFKRGNAGTPAVPY